MADMKREFEALIIKKKELEQKKNRLNQQLVTIKKKVNKLLENENEQVNQVDSTDDAVYLSQWEELNDCLNMYRLFGISVIDVGDGKMHLRFDTSYKDHYFESYQVKLDQGTISEHSLPCFVPIHLITRKLLQISLSEFAIEIQTYLLSYVRRREQLTELKEKYNSNFCGNIDYSMAYDYVSCHFKLNNGSLKFILSITLVYDLKTHLPEEIHIEIPASNSVLQNLKESYESTLKGRASIFKECVLAEATEKFLASLRDDV